jgi:ADP-ribose pyrophosphatase YjhB (NUDIX family)
MTLKLHHRLLQRGLLAYSRVSRGMTLGVRALLLKENHVLLVKHTYVPGWYLPGGGVEAGETLMEALRREIVEEVGAAFTGAPRLFAIYRNAAIDPRDHVALFVCSDWDQDPAAKVPNREILLAELFPLAHLPAGTTPATRARIAEVIDGKPPAADW